MNSVIVGQCEVLYWPCYSLPLLSASLIVVVSDEGRGGAGFLCWAPATAPALAPSLTRAAQEPSPPLTALYPLQTAQQYSGNAVIEMMGSTKRLWPAPRRAAPRFASPRLASARSHPQRPPTPFLAERRGDVPRAVNQIRVITRRVHAQLLC